MVKSSGSHERPGQLKSPVHLARGGGRGHLRRRSPVAHPRRCLRSSHGRTGSLPPPRYSSAERCRVGRAPAPCERPRGRRRRPSCPRRRGWPADLAAPRRAPWPAPRRFRGARPPGRYRRGVRSRGLGALPTCAPGPLSAPNGRRQPARQSRPQRRGLPPTPPPRMRLPAPPPLVGRPALRPPSCLPPPFSCTIP